MRAKTGLLVAFCFGCVPLGAQNPKPPQPADEPVAVFTVHPRLFLPAPRLRLLKRERERSSARWQQFELLVAGNAPMPERGFAHALYYQVSGNAQPRTLASCSALTQAGDEPASRAVAT